MLAVLDEDLRDDPARRVCHTFDLILHAHSAGGDHRSRYRNHKRKEQKERDNSTRNVDCAASAGRVLGCWRL
ncbi:hypothetical protein GCM10011515_23670 [Tsuneonella deserti]|uniref:Uncharacterized protein n=1 Tax=Tsuneonella deserti TaxID=2035528 RepID=A0ABQ1SAA7_9SPHN|nr:hypothetical protein GCM10011515_23670 [Tsuneonella deserti]